MAPRHRGTLEKQLEQIHLEGLQFAHPIVCSAGGAPFNNRIYAKTYYHTPKNRSAVFPDSGAGIGGRSNKFERGMKTKILMIS
ncbi:MAG: hypothetical protein GY874_06730 [Desulfobacteraceae bacterium]|nr:hypothetical protein [Desulfobacteraceae bacterium]